MNCCHLFIFPQTLAVAAGSDALLLFLFVLVCTQSPDNAGRNLFKLLLVAFLDLFIAYFSLGCLCLHFKENWKERESKVKPMVLTSAFENKIHSTLCE